MVHMSPSDRYMDMLELHVHSPFSTICPASTASLSRAASMLEVRARTEQQQNPRNQRTARATAESFWQKRKSTS